MSAAPPKPAFARALGYFVLVALLENAATTCRGEVIYKFVNKQTGIVTGRFIFDDPSISGTSNWSVPDGAVLSSLLSSGISGVVADFGSGFESATGGDLSVTSAFGSTSNGNLIDFGALGNTGSGPLTFASGYTISGYAFNQGSPDIVIVGIPGGASFNVAGEFRLMPTLVGDANGDCTVGAADYALWAAQFGQSGLDLSADFDCNGSVGAGDYALWAANFGNTCPPDGTNVPEPASIVLAIGAVAVALARRFSIALR